MFRVVQPLAFRVMLGEGGELARREPRSKASETRAGTSYLYTKAHGGCLCTKPLARIPSTILGRQMDALRAYVRRVEAVGGLPAYGGWEDIPKFAPRVGDIGE